MRCGAPAMPLTIAIWILLSVALDGGLRGTQTAPDRAPVGRRWMPMPLFPPGASVVLLLGRCPSPTLNPSFHVRRPQFECQRQTWRRCRRLARYGSWSA
jgi:hypothetical protein